jgi:hypothetical protein
MNTVQQQREQSRTEHLRAAEWANDLASAAEWLREQIAALDPTTEAKRTIVKTVLVDIDRMVGQARSNAEHHADRARVIADTLAAAARPQPNRGGSL